MDGSLKIILIILFALLLRWSITYHPHSGEGKPPMFGDYEAQRHWQEITLNLPIENWYINSTNNDLQYWGLDYPPLTAYHSFLLGYVANKVNSSYVKLHESRGLSSTEHKYFMRLTVLFADILTYIPAMIYFVLNLKIFSSVQKKEYDILGFTKKDIVLLTALSYPGLILIDYGHFQYNCVSLGLFVASFTAMSKSFFVLGSFLFVAALNYKQMELYHALPIFFYILGNHIPNKRKPWLPCIQSIACVSFTVLLSFFLMWFPFLQHWETFSNVIFRLFPFARGVFEDKVANVWCAINIVYKLRNVFTNAQLAQICLIVTTFAVLPSCINLCLNPSKERFLISLINSALAFFLFSFQVHEKSILLAAIPVLLYFHNDPLPCFWFLLITHFSMLPLFLKDDLYTAYFGTFLFYYVLVSCTWPDIFNLYKLTSGTSVDPKQTKLKRKHSNKSSAVLSGRKNFLYYYKDNFPMLNYVKSWWLTILFYNSLLGIIILSIVSNFLKPPSRYPDLFALLISVYSCGHFILFYLYFNYKQFCIPKVTVNKSKLH